MATKAYVLIYHLLFQGMAPNFETGTGLTFVLWNHLHLSRRLKDDGDILCTDPTCWKVCTDRRKLVWSCQEL